MTTNKDLKSVPSITKQTSASPKTAQIVDSIPTKTLKEIKQGNKKIPEKENPAGEVEQRTDQIVGEGGSEESEARDKFVPKNPKTQAGEDLFVILENPLLYIKDQQAKAKAEAQARQASHAGQAYHGEVVPRSPISTISGERSIPFYAVAGLAIIVTLPFIHRFLKNVRLKRQKKNKEEEVSFFVNAYVMIRGMEIGDCLIATENCDIINAELNLDPKIEQFMIGEVVGIIDETVYQVTIQVFPNKRFVYTNGMTYLVPFVPLEEVNCPAVPRSDQPIFK